MIFATLSSSLPVIRLATRWDSSDSGGLSTYILTFLKQPLLPSSKNSDEAQLYLLDETNCNRFFYSAERERKAAELKQLRPGLNTFELPALDVILKGEEGLRFYSFTQTYEEAEDKVFLVVHSSGSTGMIDCFSK